MARRKRYLVLGAATLIVAVCMGIWSQGVRRSTDRDFILLESHPSPDGRFILLVYHYDTGAFGFSRTWWAVPPIEYEGVNLLPYELPDGYIGVGWVETGELLVRPWTPYYNKRTKHELNSGEVFSGVMVELLPEERTRRHPM